MKLLTGAALLAAIALSTTTGCSIYFGDDDDDDCDYGYDEYDPGPSIGYLDPVTGQCHYIGGGGGGGGGCGVRPLDQAEEAPGALPDEALCDTYCSGLDEPSCLATPGCRGGYLDFCTGSGGDCYPVPSFYTCWATAPSGPVQGGDCYLFDPWECSRHDDCLAVHGSYSGGGAGEADDSAGIQPPIGDFLYCAPEPTPTPTGSCYGDVYCDSLPPECPEGSLPGIANGCWTGECIPIELCERPPLICENITDEVTCVSRTDCAPIYVGVDCTCPDGSEPMGDPAESGCTCADWIFQSCTTGFDQVEPF
jgi:hypothetical protein